MARSLIIHPIPRGRILDLEPVDREPAGRAPASYQPMGRGPLSQVDGFRAELEGVYGERGERLEIVERTIGPASGRYQRVKEQYDDARNSVENARVLVRNRELLRHHFNGALYAAFAVLFLAFEAPINKFVFDVAFGSLAFYSWSGAITLGLILLIIAHFNGVALRQVWSESRKRLYVGKIVQAIVFTAFLLVAVASLAVARYKFALTGAGQGLGSLVGDIAALQSVGDVWTLVRAAFSDTAAQILAIANAGGILAAVIVAMISHDPDANYDSASRRMARADRALHKLEREYGRALARINRKFAPRIRRLHQNIAHARQRAGAAEMGAG
jgi:succinate dehydrogenase hydrophobic anchor subunit